jgi:cob(I)alamin adenosyltransferase
MKYTKLMKKGLVHIYTGDGKGKSSAAIGLAIRALAHRLSVCYVYFHKRPEKYGSTELESLHELGAEIFGIAKGHPYFEPEIDVNQHREWTRQGLEEVAGYVRKKKFDVLILDEVIVSVKGGFLEAEQLIDFIKNKPAGLELVLTGRGATEEMIEHADYVSRISHVKHPLDQNIKARKGIEF